MQTLTKIWRRQREKEEQITPALKGAYWRLGWDLSFYFPLLVNLFGVHFVSHKIAKEGNASVRYGKYVN